MVLIIYLMLIQFRLFLKLKLKYFYNFWSWIELGIIICSWMGVGIYVWRYHECSRIGHLFAQTNGYTFINLQLSTYINNFLTFLYGFCCFFGTIKFLHLCRFSQRLSLFSVTLQYAAKELLAFAMMFSIVYVAFLCLYYLLFNSKLASCSSLLQAAEMIFQMALTRYNVHDLSEVATFLGPFCFSIFILLVVFICLNMVMSIINQNFRRAREDMKKENHEIFSFMLKKFQRWTGLKKPTAIEIHEERDARMRSEYYDPIERFPEKMDQLLEAMNRVNCFLLFD